MPCWSLLLSGQPQTSTFLLLKFPVQEEFHALRTIESCVNYSADAKKQYKKEQIQVADFYKEHGTDTLYIFFVQEMERLRVLPDFCNLEDLKTAVLRNKNVHNVSTEHFWQVSQDNANKIAHISSRLLKITGEGLVCKEVKMRSQPLGAHLPPMLKLVDHSDEICEDDGEQIGDEFINDEEYIFSST